MFRHILVGQRASEASGGEVHLAGESLHAVILHRDGVGVECICGENIGTGVEVLPVDVAQNVGLRDVEYIVIALDLVGEVGEAFAAIVGLRESEALNHCPHAPIKDEDALLKELLYGFLRHNKLMVIYTYSQICEAVWRLWADLLRNRMSEPFLLSISGLSEINTKQLLKRAAKISAQLLSQASIYAAER